MILAKEQRIGAAVLLTIAFAGWFVAAFWPRTEPALPEPPKKRTWEQRKDSMRRADSIRYATWAAEREQRYDSFRLADSMRREEWKRIRQQQYDSFRLADSLWRDSVGWRFAARHEKKDTILDLNHCDTTALQYIRGIGRYTAIQIVKYREQLGGYYNPRQLTDEPFAKLRLDTLLQCFTADTTSIERMKVNTASVERLQRHPYLRFSQAKAIYTLRRKRIALHSMDDLRGMPELTDEDLKRLAPYFSFE